MLNVYIKDPSRLAIGSIIWMHGLGADASDMAGLVEQLPLDLPLRHVFVDAPVRPVTLNHSMPMRAWYDIVGTALTDREDREGIAASASYLREIMETEIREGCLAEHLFLAGFSQGGAMALYTALHTPLRLGGVIALSAYMPMRQEATPVLDVHTPLFIASGQYDPIVLPAWTQASADYLYEQGFSAITSKEYAMEHSICVEEMNDLSHWLRARFCATQVAK